ncbi:MAG: nuclear transport factor 2 family protein [Chloroflexota bacterium]|nr:nuclear transport factor 2 family protein [Chloroflexota bacterium]
MHDPVEIVRAWHEAVNAGDTERLADLVANDVEIGGPHGSTYGLAVLIDWVGRTGIQMQPTDWYQRGETIIVCQRATWRSEDGEPGVPQNVGSVFIVRDNRIGSILRYADLSGAFAATGLSETDRVSG